jgi:hypothetical protein
MGQARQGKGAAYTVVQSALPAQRPTDWWEQHVLSAHVPTPMALVELWTAATMLRALTKEADTRVHAMQDIMAHRRRTEVQTAKHVQPRLHA